MDTPQPITLTTTIARSPEMISAEMGEETVMMNMDQGEYYGLDDIASHIWELLAQPLTVVELCEQLVQSYAVELEMCQRETLSFLHELRDKAVIVIAEAAKD